MIQDPGRHLSSALPVIESSMQVAPSEREVEADGIGRGVLQQCIPAEDVSPEIAAIAIHIHRIRAFFQPPFTRPLVDEIDLMRV